MKCRLGHSHPPERLIAATGNPTNQPRPYHCPECQEVRKQGVNTGHWNEFKT